MSIITVAVIQSFFGASADENVLHAEQMLKLAVSKGAQIILLPELFEHPYFCKTQQSDFLSLAKPLESHQTILHLQQFAAQHKVVLPVSFYEQSGRARFNTVAIIDADGSLLGTYRKSHIPDGPGYQEKFYFSPGDTGFRVWKTRYGNIGVGICWDQWFPEVARAMTLMGAQLLLYPTAIGEEPHIPTYNSSKHWQITMRGHAAANMIPVIAANRVGNEQQLDVFGHTVKMNFYGQSFICDECGSIRCEAGDQRDKIIYADFDLEAIEKNRDSWGLFRDRRPDLYHDLMQLGERK